MAAQFGKLLDKHLKESGQTQIQMLKILWHNYEFETKDRKGNVKLKYSESDVSKWKSGRTKPPQDVIRALEDILYAPKGSLLEAAGYDSAAELRKVQEGEKRGTQKLTNTLNLSWLMSRFLDCLRTPDPCRISSIDTEPNGILWVEEHPLFLKIKGFLNNKFWRKFNDWKEARVQYFEKCMSLLGDVHQKAEEKSKMKTTECWEKEGLNDTFWQRIYTHVLLKTKPPSLDKLDEAYLKRLETTEFEIEANCLIVKGENCVLAKGEPFWLERVSKAYWGLITGFASSSEPKQIWELWKELAEAEKFLHKQLEPAYREIAPNWFRYRELEI